LIVMELLRSRLPLAFSRKNATGYFSFHVTCTFSPDLNRAKAEQNPRERESQGRTGVLPCLRESSPNVKFFMSSGNRENR
jgi:hypothetical protein